MPKGGYRPGAGRPKGAKSTRKSEATATKPASSVRKASVSPLEYMLSVMNDAEADPVRRDRMAIAAAPYEHPRKSDIGKKLTAQERAVELAKTSKFAPPQPPKLAVDNTKRKD